MCWFAEPRQTRRVADDKFNGVFVLFWFFFLSAKRNNSLQRCVTGENAERRGQFGGMKLSKAFRGNWKGKMKER